MPQEFLNLRPVSAVRHCPLSERSDTLMPRYRRDSLSSALTFNGLRPNPALAQRML
jgi:hypothetical protein